MWKNQNKTREQVKQCGLILSLFPAKMCQSIHSIFFKNEEIFVQLDELDEWDRITQAYIGFNNSLTKAQKTF